MSRSFSPSLTQCVIKLHEEHHALEDYQGGVPRWCSQLSARTAPSTSGTE